MTETYYRMRKHSRKSWGQELEVDQFCSEDIKITEKKITTG